MLPCCQSNFRVEHDQSLIHWKSKSCISHKKNRSYPFRPHQLFLQYLFPRKKSAFDVSDLALSQCHENFHTMHLHTIFIWVKFHC